MRPYIGFRCNGQKKGDPCHVEKYPKFWGVTAVAISSTLATFSLSGEVFASQPNTKALSSIGSASVAIPNPGSNSGTFLPPSLASQAAKYVTTRNYQATISPAFKQVASSSEYAQVQQLVNAYNAATIQAKTTGVQETVYIPSSRAAASGVIRPYTWVGSGGCNGWESFSYEGWDGFQWYMNQCYATGLVDELVAGAALFGVVAIALDQLGAGSAVGGVAGALALAYGGAAAYIAETQSMCGGSNIWIGLHYWLIPSHGCA